MNGGPVKLLVQGGQLGLVVRVVIPEAGKVGHFVIEARSDSARTHPHDDDSQCQEYGSPVYVVPRVLRVRLRGFRTLRCKLRVQFQDLPNEALQDERQPNYVVDPQKRIWIIFRIHSMSVDFLPDVPGSREPEVHVNHHVDPELRVVHNEGDLLLHRVFVYVNTFLQLINCRLHLRRVLVVEEPSLICNFAAPEGLRHLDMALVAHPVTCPARTGEGPFRKRALIEGSRHSVPGSAQPWRGDLLGEANAAKNTVVGEIVSALVSRPVLDLGSDQGR
mmetsp:Transcript_63450/g.138176  ORF Transcript_63450/g.138176 Transcript_63450/m.138176 type:complete len:276 (+) Transcript_63450:1528-2355(+)